MNIDFFKSFAIKNIDTNYKSYDHYIIQFYKQTEDFNESYILDSTNININNQGRYLLYNFFWKKGQYAGYEYYVNGTLKHYKYIY